MGYEAHIAGLGDRPPGKRVTGRAIGRLQKASADEIAERRAAIIAALPPLDFVNGGGTGSLHTTAREPAVTEVTAGSGFYAPTLFDHYSAFTLKPAAMFALPVVRRPSAKVATLLGGGYVASGEASATRLPAPYLPRGLRLDPREGAGEVQTPVIGGGGDLKLGDRVYLRHAKAGELCERFDTLLLVGGDRVVDEVPTYRGEGRAFL
jgi:D-serine deaminase-like pyridoxal phosphate-dependent protein